MYVAPMDAFVSSRLTEARIARGMRQNELSQRSGVSQAHISQLENGIKKNPGINTLVAIEKALGLEHGALSKDPKPKARKAVRA